MLSGQVGQGCIEVLLGALENLDFMRVFDVGRLGRGKAGALGAFRLVESLLCTGSAVTLRSQRWRDQDYN